MSFHIRSIDHVVLAARDLDRQAALFRSLGFQVGPRNRHPWGTENHIVQFGDSFLELISTGPDFHRPVDPDPHQFSFPVFIHDYLERTEGLGMLALTAGPSVDDRRQFRDAGIGDFEPFTFERHARRPDGSDTVVAFTLTFARSRLMPDTGFFTCRHHYPSNFWNPSFQSHPNGATGIAGVAMLASDPADHAEFLSHLTGQREMHSTSLGLEVALGAGQKIEVLTPEALRFRYGFSSAPTAAAEFVAISIRAKCDRIRANAAESGLRLLETPAGLVLPATSCFGAALCFIDVKAA
jgi:hypothetical protein